MNRKQLFIIAALLSAVCFFLALFTAIPAALRPAPEPDSFEAFCQDAKGQTEVQWESTFTGLKGRLVTWAGSVTAVSNDGGQYNAWIDDRIQLHNLPPDTALALQKGQRIEFTGELEYLDQRCTARLVNVLIR